MKIFGLVGILSIKMEPEHRYDTDNNNYHPNLLELPFFSHACKQLIGNRGKRQSFWTENPVIGEE